MKQKTHIQRPSNLRCHSICTNLCIQARAPIHVRARKVSFKLRLKVCGFILKQLIIFSSRRDTISPSVSLHMINSSTHEKETRMLLSVTGYWFMLQSIVPTEVSVAGSGDKRGCLWKTYRGHLSVWLTRYNGKKWRWQYCSNTILRLVIMNVMNVNLMTERHLGGASDRVKNVVDEGRNYFYY